MYHKKILFIASIFMFTQLLISCNEQNKAVELPNTNTDFEITKATIYTTSSNSEIKLQLTSEKIDFSNFKQPLETEASILISPIPTNV